MDFSKIKPAVEEITLSAEQKEQIINSCQGKKRKFNYKPLIAAAAAAIIISVIFSPGFLFRAKTADTAENAAQGNAKEDYYVADEEYYYAQSYSSSAGGAMQDVCEYADFTAFTAPDFTELYSVIPAEFVPLAGDGDFSGWLSEVSPEGGMAILQFVMHFGIERSDFDSANIAFAARTGKFFDADSVYSFDKELTDSLYRK